MPKSMAPSDSRLAGIFAWCMKMKASSSAMGMVSATISAARGLPRKTSSTRVTTIRPSARVLPTVWVVRSISVVRSR